jgi:hypothetical protein
MKNYIVSFLVFPFILTGAAQNLASFTDYMGRFMIFDNGNISSYETNQVKFSQVGGNCIIYADNSDNFKAYYQGRIYELADFTPSKYQATDNLAIFFSNRIVSVFDNGTVVNLPGWASSYVSGDSIVGFYDLNSSYYKVYYNGTTTELPDVVNSTSITSFKAGDNILAYLNADGLFKAYYHNQVYDLGTSHVSSYQMGSSIVAYMDEYNMAFKVFYDGNSSTLETVAPKSFKAGDQLVAYVDNAGNFKIFYKGDVSAIASFEPDFYTVEDNVVAFGTENVSFNIFYKGKVYQLESNTPANYQLDFNSAAYVDKYGYLKIFTDGETTQASDLKIPKFKLTGNVLMFKTGPYDFHFFLNGKAYTN